MLETTDGGQELVDALICIARGVMPNVPVQGLQAKEGPASAASRPVEGHRDAARPWLRHRSPQQPDIAHSVSNRPLEHLFDETLRLLVKNARQLKKGTCPI